MVETKVWNVSEGDLVLIRPVNASYTLRYPIVRSI